MGYTSKTNGRNNQGTLEMNTQDKELGVCIFCDLPVFREQEIFNLGIERPIRIDLVTHKTCYKKYRDNGDLGVFLNENLEEYIEKYEDGEHVEKKKTRRTKKH
jgi:hypothetical protein